MAAKFKRNDVVYFTSKNEMPSHQYPIKGSLYEMSGLVLNVDNNNVVKVLWSGGEEYSYYVTSLTHKHRIKMFLRHVYDDVKEDINNLKSKISGYILYRRFKVDDVICLKHPTSRLSTCDAGTIERKCFPNLVVYWGTNGVDFTYQSFNSIEHYTGLDPNKSFEVYKRSIS